MLKQKQRKWKQQYYIKKEKPENKEANKKEKVETEIKEEDKEKK